MCNSKPPFIQYFSGYEYFAKSFGDFSTRQTSLVFGVARIASRQMLRVPLLIIVAISLHQPVKSSDLTYLQDALAGIQAGEWVKVSSSAWSTAWPTGPDAVQGGYASPWTILPAWSSYAWDSTRGNLLLFGGGHGNYKGNEVYVWSGSTGAWSLGSLPSFIDSNGFVPDNSAPQSAHTYDTSTYLPNLDRLLIVSGPGFPQGGNMQSYQGRTGPWLWDPALADGSKVGGASGTGWRAITPGGNMWENRQGNWSGSEPASYINSTAAYSESTPGTDIIYITSEQYQQGWPSLYKYTLGQGGSPDKWELVGTNSGNAPAIKGAGAIDSEHNIFVRTAAYNGSSFDLLVWDLAGTSQNPTQSVAVRLQFSGGIDFSINADYGIDYDPESGQFLIWDGWTGGTVYSFSASFDESGSIKPIWIINQNTPGQPSHPNGNYLNGVLGKWQYISEIGAFMALDEYSAGDAGVWLYKPTDVGAVGEPSTWLMWLAGTFLLASRFSRLVRAFG